MMTRRGFVGTLLALSAVGCLTPKPRPKRRVPGQAPRIQYARARALRGLTPRFMAPYGAGDYAFVEASYVSAPADRCCACHIPATLQETRGMVGRGEMRWCGRSLGKSLPSSAALDDEARRIFAWFHNGQ